MQNYNWDLKTQFVFPEEYGTVEDVVFVDIKPRFQLIETEDSLRLVGIYHLTSTVRFDPHELPEYSEGTLIEHLELTGNDGYFEYALPLEVNLPKEKVPVGCHPEIYIEDVHYDVYDGSSAAFNWDVKCIISNAIVEPNEDENNLIQFESYLESSSIPLEIPSASAFAEMIQEVKNDKPEVSIVHEEPILQEAKIEEELVELTDDAVDDESLTNYFEPEVILQSSNLINPEQETLHAETSLENNELDDLVQSSNLLNQSKPVDLAFDNDDFFSGLSESYSLLDLKSSNKVSPE